MTIRHPPIDMAKKKDFSNRDPKKVKRQTEESPFLLGNDGSAPKERRKFTGKAGNTYDDRLRDGFRSMQDSGDG